MRSSVIAVLLLVVYGEARPSSLFDVRVRPTFGSGSSYIIGGEDAKLGEFPWQISLQDFFRSWEHICGGSVLSSSYVLTAAHCVDGAAVQNLRVVAGVINSSSTDGVISYVASYKKHELYGSRAEAFISDDIAILTLASPIYTNGVTIQYAKLPENNDDLFVGGEGAITGWGRIDAGFDGSLILQKALIGVIDTITCQQLLLPFEVRYFKVDDTQICLLDAAEKTTACNGDSGGPFNLNKGSGQAIVAGLCSWSPKSPSAECLTGTPTMYTRTSAFLDWIKTNTP